MRTAALVGLLLLIAAAAYLLGRGGNASPPPPAVPSRPPRAWQNIVFEPDHIELGNVPWGTNHAQQVTILNRGSDTAQIETIQTSCECTLLSEENQQDLRLPSGSSALVEFTFAAGLITGDRHAEIRAETSDGVKAVLYLAANVVGTWVLSTETIDFGPVEIGTTEPVVRTLEWQSQCDEYLGLDTDGAPWLTHESKPSSAGDIQITLRVDPTRVVPGYRPSTRFFAPAARYGLEEFYLCGLAAFDRFSPMSIGLLSLGARAS